MLQGVIAYGLKGLVRTVDPIRRGLRRQGLADILPLSGPVRTVDPIRRGLRLTKDKKSCSSCQKSPAVGG